MARPKCLPLLLAAVLVAGCSKSDPPPPDVLQRIALAKQDAARYVGKKVCLPATEWPVVESATNAEARPLVPDLYEDLRTMGLLTRTTKLVPQRVIDGTPYSLPVFVYDLTPKAAPFVSKGPHHEQDLQALCFAPLQWMHDEPVEVIPYEERTGYDLMFEAEYQPHQAIYTASGKVVRAQIEYHLRPETEESIWEDKFTAALGGDAEFRKKNDAAMDRLYDTIYQRVSTVDLTVENRGDGWKIADSHFDRHAD